MKKGQTTTEVIVLLPLVLFIIFGLIQACQLGVGLVMVNYAAGSIARKIARSPTADGSAFQSTLDSLMIAGMKTGTLKACCEKGSCTDVTNNLVVTAQARISAYPVVGPFLNTMAPTFATSSKDWQPACEAGPVPALGFTGPPDYQFIVRGMAMARRNYLQ